MRIRIRAAASGAFALSFAVVMSMIVLGTFGCTEDSKRVHEPTGPPTIIGEWEGTLVVIHRTGADTLLSGPIDTHFEFTDSNFTYYHFNQWGPIDEYRGTEAYILTDSTIYLYPTAGLDPMLVPYRQLPYDLSLEYERLIMVRIDEYPGDAEQEQRIDLRREH